MAKEGEFVTKLRKDWSAKFGLHAPFQFTAVAGENDEFVPYESSLAPFDKSVHAIVAGNHLEIIRPRERNHRGVQIVVNRLSGGTAQIGPWDGARLAVALALVISGLAGSLDWFRTALDHPNGRRPLPNH
jgi:hypothetical protein